MSRKGSHPVSLSDTAEMHSVAAHQQRDKPMAEKTNPRVKPLLTIALTRL